MYRLILKRIFDIGSSFIAISLLIPLLIPVMIILKFTGEGEIFYLQERIGYKNKKFLIFKFATMVKNSSKMGTGSLTLRNDPRVLPFGKILRKSKINELPQILNVLIGDMSIVGARPQMEVDFLSYSEEVQKNIYNTKPGLTGIGSIIFRDEEYLISNAKNPKQYYKEIIAPYKGEVEMWYQRKISFITDMKLILLTVVAILFPDSANVSRFFSDIPIKKSKS